MDKKNNLDFSTDKSQKENNNNDITQIPDSNKYNERAFNYIEIDNPPEKFDFESEEKTLIFNNDKEKYDYTICILLKDDSFESSKLLRKTLEEIYLNLRNTHDIGISSFNTLICIFIGEIQSYALFHRDKIKSVKKSQSFYLYSTAHYTTNQQAKILLFTKTSELSYAEALRCYYMGIVQQIRIDKKPIFSSVITAGVEPKSLKKLILCSFNNLKFHGAAVGVVESNGYGLFSMIEQYERTHFNIYNMNFYGVSGAVPISSLISTIYIDDKIFLCLKEFYTNKFNTNQSIDYHDYYLGLFFNKNNINVHFYSDETSGILHTNELEFTDYQEIWVNRYSGYYGNIFNLLSEFTNCNSSCFKKIFLFFQIIGFLIEFIYPALSSMVIYSIFYEAFDTYDYRLATFFTMLYIFMLLASGMCSLVTKRPKEMRMSNLFLYIFMEVYYLLVLICSVIAMNNVKRNESKNEYKFNNSAIACIIVFTFVPYIIPLIFKIGAVSQNFFNMLIYIGMGAPSSTSHFLMAQIWNASDTPGGKEVDERKCFVLLFFFLFNLFFGSMTFFNYTRKKRVESIMGYGIFYLIYNFFKVTGIVINMLGKSDEAVNPSKNAQIIDSIKNSIGKGDDNDMRSEQKMLKNSSQFNNNYYNNNEDGDQYYNENTGYNENNED